MTVGNYGVVRLQSVHMSCAESKHRHLHICDFSSQNRRHIVQPFNIHLTVEALRSLNPAMKIILTVSPVRYVGEGLHRSTLGKATLLLACEAVTRAFSDVIYFPSYEIMMDDLRDYRFYAADMKHPSEVAVDYIYDIFAESFFDKATRDLAVKASRLSARMAHRNICAASEATASFQAKTLEMARRLSEEYPEVSQQIMKHIQLP